MTNKEQYRRGEYGFTPLSQMVDRYMGHSFNNGRKYYKNMLIIAADMWKQLYWKTLQVIKNKRVAVDRGTMTVRIPSDCMKVRGVKIIDHCDHTQDLTYDSYKSILTPVSHGHGCGCKACGCDSEACTTLKGITYVTEDVTLGVPPGALVNVFTHQFNHVFGIPPVPSVSGVYQRVIKTRVCANGDLVQEITEPFAQKSPTGQLSIVNRLITNWVAKLTVKPCGCIEPTVENEKIYYDACGYPLCEKPCDPTTVKVMDNGRGLYKIDDEHSLIYLYDTTAAQVEVSYQSNGEECVDDVMIPDYCQEAMFALLYQGSIRFRQAISRQEKNQAKVDAIMEKQELYEFLNPIVPHQFLELQHYFSKW